MNGRNRYTIVYHKVFNYLCLLSKTSINFHIRLSRVKQTITSYNLSLNYCNRRDSSRCYFWPLDINCLTQGQFCQFYSEINKSLHGNLSSNQKITWLFGTLNNLQKNLRIIKRYINWNFSNFSYFTVLISFWINLKLVV